MWTRAWMGLFGGLSALALAMSLATTADAAPKPPRPTPQYVALGDSYAAGVGAGSYINDGTDCHRTLLSYGGVIASSSTVALNLQACSGAVASDVVALQLGTLSATTTYVTITVGGNDIGFADVISTCMGSDTTGCLNDITAAEAFATSTLPGRLDAVFAAVTAKATSAKIVATNYPRLFNGVDCSLLTSFTSTEMTRLNDGADTLSNVIKAAAARAGITFSDVRTPFVGHAVCDGTPWVNNVTLPTYNSFHPNASGYKYGYAPTVKTGLGIGGTKPGKGQSTVTTGGQTSSDTTRGVVKAGT